MTKLIVLTVQTGFITAAAAGVQLTLFLLNPTNFSDIPAFILGKMYSNVLLATLNARTIIAREATHEVHSSSGFDESNGTRNGTASGLVFGVPTQPTQAEIGMRILDIHRDNPHEEEAPVRIPAVFIMTVPQLIISLVPTLDVEGLLCRL